MLFAIFTHEFLHRLHDLGSFLACVMQLRLNECEWFLLVLKSLNW